jgi:hypothetical protein
MYENWKHVELLIFNLGPRCRYLVSIIPWPLYPQGKYVDSPEGGTRAGPEVFVMRKPLALAVIRNIANS